MNCPNEGGVGAEKVKQLVAVAIDTVLANPRWGEAHCRSAMLQVATVADVREVDGIVISGNRHSGLDADGVPCPDPG